MLNTVRGRILHFGLSMFCIGTASCGDGTPPAMDQIEIFAAGLEISVEDDGAGQFYQRLENKKGRFNLGPQGFAKLRTQTEPYRVSHDAISADVVSDYITGDRRCEGDYVTDQGGITFHWKGQSIDQFYMVDYGCDSALHAARNKALREILASLPVPPPALMP